MRDRRLEQQVEGLDAFLERWAKLGAYLKPHGAAAAREEDFQRLKSELGQDHGWLLSELELDLGDDDGAERVLGAATSLRQIAELSPTQARVLEQEWVETSHHLQSILGRLKARKLQLASISVVGYYIGGVIRSPLFMLAVIVAVVAGALWFWNFTQTSPEASIERRGVAPTLTENKTKP